MALYILLADLTVPDVRTFGIPRVHERRTPTFFLRLCTYSRVVLVVTTYASSSMIVAYKTCEQHDEVNRWWVVIRVMIVYSDPPSLTADNMAERFRCNFLGCGSFYIRGHK